MSKLDLIKSLRTAVRKTGFKSPVTVADLRGALGQRRRLYTDEATISAFEEIGESQNDNLGKDIASIDGVTLTFRRNPIIWVPYLDVSPAATNPVYLIDHAAFYPVVLAGDYLRESAPEKKADQHNTFVVFVDLTYNYFCYNRRVNSVFYRV